MCSSFYLGFANIYKNVCSGRVTMASVSASWPKCLFARKNPTLCTEFLWRLSRTTSSPSSWQVRRDLSKNCGTRLVVCHLFSVDSRHPTSLCLLCCNAFKSSFSFSFLFQIWTRRAWDVSEKVLGPNIFPVCMGYFSIWKSWANATGLGSSTSKSMSSTSTSYTILLHHKFPKDVDDHVQTIPSGV